MKKQIRYKDEFAIVKRIDRYHIKLNNANIEFFCLAQQISEVKLLGGSEWKLKPIMREQERIQARIDRIGRRLNRLKEKLAEYRTPQLVAIDNGDRSVAA